MTRYDTRQGLEQCPGRILSHLGGLSSCLDHQTCPSTFTHYFSVFSRWVPRKTLIMTIRRIIMQNRPLRLCPRLADEFRTRFSIRIETVITNCLQKAGAVVKKIYRACYMIRDIVCGVYWKPGPYFSSRRRCIYFVLNTFFFVGWKELGECGCCSPYITASSSPKLSKTLQRQKLWASVLKAQTCR